MDVENFKKVFLPLHPKLFRIAYALVENKADAEDILHGRRLMIEFIGLLTCF